MIDLDTDFEISKACTKLDSHYVVILNDKKIAMLFKKKPELLKGILYLDDFQLVKAPENFSKIYYVDGDSVIELME